MRAASVTRFAGLGWELVGVLESVGPFASGAQDDVRTREPRRRSSMARRSDVIERFTEEAEASGLQVEVQRYQIGRASCRERV